MSHRMHGHAPRVRRKVNQSQEDGGTELVIDGNEILSEALRTAIGTVVGIAVSRVIFNKDGMA